MVLLAIGVIFAWIQFYENLLSLWKFNTTKIQFYEYSIYENVGDENTILRKWNSMRIQGDEISGYETSMGRKFRHENTIYVNEIYEYSIDQDFLLFVEIRSYLFITCYQT